jgi:hypothetical protein
MPGWKVHTFSGLVATAVLIITLFFILDSYEIKVDFHNYFPLAVAGFACVLGSLMPDYDYRKTMIRHTIGPAIASFITFGYLYTRGSSNNLGSAIIIFFIILIIFAVIGILPMKHHGKLHSLTAAVIYGLGWGVTSYFIFQLTQLFWLAVIIVFALVGYILHLLIDLDLKM